LQFQRDRDELCALAVGDLQQRRGVMHLRIQGKGGKLRYLPLHTGTAEVIDGYLEAAGHGDDAQGALFRPLKNNRHDDPRVSITTDGVYKMLAGYAAVLKIDVAGFGPHALPPTHWNTRPILPRSRNGWGTPTTRSRASTTAAKCGRRIARRSRWCIEAV
jgi:integrase